MRTTCNGTKRNGDPCAATAVLASGFCTAHDPAYRERRAEQAAKGGRNKSTRERAGKNLPDDMKRLGARLLTAFDDVYEVRMPARTAAALSTIATAYCRVWEAGRVATTLNELDVMLKAFESGDLEAFKAAADDFGKAA